MRQHFFHTIIVAPCERGAFEFVISTFTMRLLRESDCRYEPTALLRFMPSLPEGSPTHAVRSSLVKVAPFDSAVNHASALYRQSLASDNDAAIADSRSALEQYWQLDPEQACVLRGFSGSSHNSHNV